MAFDMQRETKIDMIYCNFEISWIMSQTDCKTSFQHYFHLTPYISISYPSMIDTLHSYSACRSHYSQHVYLRISLDASERIYLLWIFLTFNIYTLNHLNMSPPKGFQEKHRRYKPPIVEVLKCSRPVLWCLTHLSHFSWPEEICVGVFFS